MIKLLAQKVWGKIKKIFTVYIQVLIVWVFFAMMVSSSYYFMSGIESRHLKQHVNDYLSTITTSIEFELLETEITLRNISLVLRHMILDGAGPDDVLVYMGKVFDTVVPHEKQMMKTTGIFGYFDVFGGIYLDGLGWEPPDDYNPLERPWYIAAVAANGDIASTELYIDMDLQEMVTTCAQRFFDDEGNPLGVICLDISLDNIVDYIISTKVAGSGYGMLLDENRIMSVHPNDDYLGRGFYEVSGVQDIINDMDNGKTVISGHKIKNYEDIPAITFFYKLNNGWYLGMIIPERNYYKSLHIIAQILILLGAVLAGILSFILHKIIKEKQKADEQVHTMMKNFEATAHWYKSILDAIPLPVSVTGANTNWTFVNTQVENFLNVKFEDIMGKPCSNWGVHICNTPNCGIECAKRGLKHTYFTHNGSSYKVDVAILKDINNETAGYIEVVQDITQLEDITKRQMEAETVSKAKSAFLATMSHEIRTPLNAIMGITDIQIQDLKLSQNTRDALIKIHSSGDLLLHIINDILDLSKIEAGKLELVPITYDLPSLINDTVHLNLMRIVNKSVEFELHINEDVPAELFGDELRIKQILNNLLSNAFKYTDKGNVSLAINAEVNEPARHVTLIFRVSDTGQGMTQEDISNMFNEYTRFNIEANRTTEGTGLGMSITKHLIRLMNGEIYVDSEVGKGSTFTIRLPQKYVNSRVIGKEMSENLRQFRFDSSLLLRKAQITREPMPYGSVMVVDDVETNLYVATGLLALYGLKIDLVTSGFEAIDKIKAGNVYDIIFMDHMMPKMDGIEAAKIIRDMGYDHPIVALTANAVVGQAEIFLLNGFDDFISKPIDVRQLNITLNKFIRDKQPPEVIEKARMEKAEHDIFEQQPIDPELAKIFVRDAEKSVPVLENVLQNNFNENDMQNFIIHVHAMKSALANIGETELSVAASKLEHAGRDENTDIMTTITPGFIEALRVIIGKMKLRDKDSEDGEDTEEDLAFLHDKLSVIQEACAAFDKKAAKYTLNELRERKWPRNIRELLNKIAQHLLHSEFDGAIAICRKLLAM